MVRNIIIDGELPIICSVPAIEGVAYMLKEHFNDKPNRQFTVNTSIEDYDELEKNGELTDCMVYYNMEHKCKIMWNGQLPFCGSYWTEKNNEMFAKYDEIWDFQIENYEYFKYHGLGDKFKFKPLRYTSFYEWYRTSEKPQFDIQLECVIDSDIRAVALRNLTDIPMAVDDNGNYVITGERMRINLTNTMESGVKLLAKNNCRYGIDIPRYDVLCTINTFRIYEYVCMNKPVIVWDKYSITSKRYFNDLCIYTKDITAYNINNIIQNEPKSDVADTFKQMTFNDSDYNEYILDIVRDHKDRTGETIPDSVLQ
jgi:hypothetical protein